MHLRLLNASLLLVVLSTVQGQPLSRPAKIDPRLRTAAPATSVRALVTLRDQPQVEALLMAEAATSPARATAETELGRARDTASYLKAKTRLDEITVATRQRAAADVWARVRLQQDGVEGRIRALGGVVITRYWSINMLAIEIPARALDALEGDPEIAIVEQEEIHHTNLVSSVPAFGAPTMWNAGFTGRGEAVGVLDTGISAGHPGFANVDLVTKVFLDGGRRAFCFADDASSTGDLVEHGTHVSGIVAMQGYGNYPNSFGVARGLGTLYSLKVGFLTKATQAANCKDGGSFSSFDYFAAIDWALANTAIGVFNASFGRLAEGDDDTDTRKFDYYVDTFGVSFAIAAGNEGPGTGTLGTPGTAYNVITVASMNTNQTATRSDDTLSNFSSRGPTPNNRAKPDIAAPGSVIYSAAYNSNGLLGLSGTSMAAPHVAGAVALIRSAGIKDPRAIKALLINSADGAGWNGGTGWGYANLATLNGQRNTRVDSIDARTVKFYRSAPVSGTFKATIAWNRHTSVNNQVPGVFNDLGLKLYTGQDNTEVMASTYHGQNVQQVWWSKGGAMVAKVFAGDLSTDSETFGIAFTSSSTPVNGPSLSIFCTAPTAAVSAAAAFSISCTASNEGDLDAFGVNGSLSLPSGYGGGAPQAFGTVAARTSATRVFSVTTGTASGTVRANISSASYGETFTAASSNVSVIVGTTTLPVLSVSPTSLSFNYTSGGAVPGAQTASVALSKATAAATATTSAVWLRATLAAGSAPTSLAVSVVPGTLTAGTYTGTVQVNAVGAAGSPSTVTVTLRVAAASTTVRAENQRLARTVDLRNGCPVPDAVSRFFTTDAQVRLWFVLRSTKQGETGTAEWIGPNNAVFQTASLGLIASNGDYCFSPGLDVGTLPAAVQTGQWQVRVNWMGVPQFTLSFSLARPVTLSSAVTTDAIPDGVCAVPNKRSNFFVTDSRVYVWFSVRNYQGGDLPTASFVKPDGSEFYAATWNPAPNDNGTRCYWAWIDVAGSDATRWQGTWTVKGKWNGIEYFAIDFTIAAPVNVERRLMTSDPVDSLGCTVPSSTRTFVRSDATATVWFSVNGANGGDVARVEYLAPDGGLFSNIYWDPLDSGGNWCFWAWLDVASDARVQARVGKWTVNAYWNDFQVFTTDFTIAPVTLSALMLTKATLPSLCSTPVPTTSFLTTDLQVRAWFTVDDALGGDLPLVEWWSPDGVKYSSSNFNRIASDGSWCLATSLTISGQAAASKPGQWTSRVLWNGVEIYRIPFRIDKVAGSEILSLSAARADWLEETAETAEAERLGAAKQRAASLPRRDTPVNCGGASGEGSAGVHCGAGGPAVEFKRDGKARNGFGEGGDARR